MLSTALNVGGTLLKRTVEQYTSSYTAAVSTLSPRSSGHDTGHHGKYDYALTAVAITFNLLLFIPILNYVFYTLGCVYPTLAMVEDPLVEYEAIPFSDDDLVPNPTKKSSSATKLPTNIPDLESASSSSSAPPAPVVAKPITSSLRATHSLLTSHGGFCALFRALPFWLFVVRPPVLLVSVPVNILVGPRSAHLLTLFLFCQLHTTWVHMVITPPSPLPFWKRIPSLRRTLEATWFPTLVYWAALHSAMLIPYIIAIAVGITGLQNKHDWSAADNIYVLLVAIIAWCLSVAVVVPAETALVRAQASLLSDEEGFQVATIVPFDRTFGGKVNCQGSERPKPFSMVKIAIGNVSRASWKRIVVQQLKLMGVMFAIVFGSGIIIGLQNLLLNIPYWD